MTTKFLKFMTLILVSTLVSCSDDDKDTVPAAPDFTLSFNVETNQDQMGDFSHNKMAVFNSEVWSVGGYNSYNTGLHSDVWKSTNGVNWVSVTEEQFPSRRDHSLTVFDNKLWLIGGFTEITPTSFSALSDVWYSTDGETWVLATDSPLGIPSIGSHSTVVFNNRLYIIKEGSNEGAPGCTVWSSGDGITWTRETDNAFPHREDFMATVFNNEIFVIGGLQTTNYYNEIWKSTDGINWTQIDTSGSIFSPRANCAAIVYEDKLWVFGGANGTVSITDMGLWYSENGIQWNRYNPLPAEDGLRDFSALNFNDAIWVFGGMRQAETSSTISRVGTINTIKED